MMNNLTNESALSYLNLADGHNCRILKEEAMDYIVRNIADFTERPDLKNVSNDLVIEIMKALMVERCAQAYHDGRRSATSDARSTAVGSVHVQPTTQYYLWNL